VGPDRGDGDEVTAALPLEVRQRGSDPMQQAAHVDVDHPVPLVDQQGVQPRQRHHIGVVDVHVDPAVAFGGGVHERDDVLAVGHVETVHIRLAARGLDLLRDLGKAVLATGAHDHLVALAGEPERGGPTNTAARAGDQDNLGRSCGDRLGRVMKSSPR
jgi:hypothetical protein